MRRRIDRRGQCATAGLAVLELGINAYHMPAVFGTGHEAASVGDVSEAVLIFAWP